MLNKEKVYYKHLFYILLASNIVIFFILLFVTGGESASGLLFGRKWNTFMDFFNSLLQNSGDPYASYVLYPPLSNCMYKFLLLLVPESAIDSVVTDENASYFTSRVLQMRQFMLPFIMYSVITLVFLFFALVKYKQGGKKEKLFFCAICFFSGSMLFAFERANSVIVAFIGVLLFLGLKDSKNRVLKEIGIISLAVATGLKIYPVVFFVLLFNEKKYKELIRGLIYCALLFIVPMFLFYDGFDGISRMLSNLMSFSAKNEFYTGTQLDFSKMFMFPLLRFGISNASLLAIGNAFKYILSVGCVFVTLFSKQRWKVLCACVCLICGFQGTTATYLLILFIIPAIALIDEERENKKINYLYTAMLAIIIASPVVIDYETGKWTREYGTELTSYLMLAMTVMLICSGVKDMCNSFKSKLNISKKITVLSFVFMMVIIMAGALFIMPGGLAKGDFPIYAFIDISFIISSAMIKLVLLAVCSVLCFAGIIFLAWWLPKDDKYNGLRQFVKFGLVGVSNTFVSLAVYYIFYFIHEDLYFLGHAVGFIVSVLNAFYWNSKFVFKDNKERNNGPVLLKTYICYGATFLLSEFMVIAEVELFNISKIIAPVITLLVTIPLNYVLNKFFAYGEKKAVKEENSTVSDNEEK